MEELKQKNFIKTYCIWSLFFSNMAGESLPYKSQGIDCKPRIDHNKKDGGMYILPECIACMKSKWLNKDDTKSPNDVKF